MNLRHAAAFSRATWREFSTVNSSLRFVFRPSGAHPSFRPTGEIPDALALTCELHIGRRPRTGFLAWGSERRLKVSVMATVERAATGPGAGLIDGAGKIHPAIRLNRYPCSRGRCQKPLVATLW